MGKGYEQFREKEIQTSLKHIVNFLKIHMGGSYHFELAMR